MRLSYISSFDPYPSCLSAFKTELQEVGIEISPYEMNHLSQLINENPTNNVKLDYPLQLESAQRHTSDATHSQLLAINQVIK